MEADGKEEIPDLKSLRLFDSCITIGRIVHSGDDCMVPTQGVHSGYPQYLTKDNIIGVLKRYCIVEALVHEHHARVVTPRKTGNYSLLDTIKDMPQLHPVWVLEPPQKPGKAAAEALVAEMLNAGVRVARLCMKVAPPLPWLWNDLCAVLQDHRVPCMLDFGDVATIGSITDSDMAGIYDLATMHPKLPMVFSHAVGGHGVHYGLVPSIYRTKNLYLDITGVLNYWCDVALEVGPERVLFATGAPFTDPGIYVSNVQYAAGLSAESKRMICGDNLRRLIGDVK